MVDEAVDHGCGDDVVAEHFTPAAELLVGGHNQAGSLVARGHQLEEQVGGFGFERDVADLVDDQQRVAAQANQFGLELAGVILLMAMFGAVVLARRQIELGDDERRKAAGMGSMVLDVPETERGGA